MESSSRTSGSNSNSNHNKINKNTCLEAAILYTISKSSSMEETTVVTAKKRRKSHVWKEIKQSVSTGFAWLFVFLPALAYYIHRTIHQPYIRSSSSPLNVLWSKYAIVANHVTMTSNNTSSKDKSADIFFVVSSLEPPSATLYSLMYPVEQILDFSSSSSSLLTGLLWIHDKDLGRGYLLFSDVIANRIWRWEVGSGPITIGRTLFMERSGCRATECMTSNKLGSSCLATEIGSNNNNNLVVCEVGEQRIVRIEPDGARTPLITHIINSTSAAAEKSRVGWPKDIMYTPFGDLLFTNDNGLWRLEEAYKIPPISAKLSREAHYSPPTTHQQQRLHLLYSKLVHPHGLAIAKDLKHIYLSDSDPNNPIIVKLPIEDDEAVDNGDDDDDDEVIDQSNSTNSAATLCTAEKGGSLDDIPNTVFFNASEHRELLNDCSFAGRHGIQGLAVDHYGNLWAAVTGGVVVFTDSGEMLGRICIGDSLTDVAFGDDGYLYMTTQTKLLRLKVKSKKLNLPNMIAKKNK